MPQSFARLLSLSNSCCPVQRQFEYMLLQACRQEMKWGRGVFVKKKWKMGVVFFVKKSGPFLNAAGCIMFSISIFYQEGHPACKKTERWGAGMVICLERDADLHMAQLMPLPLLQYRSSIFFILHFAYYFSLQCFDAVGWVAGRASGL